MSTATELLKETLLFLDEFEYPTIVEEIRAFLASEPEADKCQHRIADARNPVVQSGYVCVDCYALFQAADHQSPRPEPEAEPTGYAQKVIEALYENGDPVSIDAAELLEWLTENTEPEAEPVAYLFDADSYCDHAPIKDELVQSLPKGILRQKIKNVRPLYTRPEQSRKPMTEEEIKELCPFTRSEFVIGFNSGVRFAEKHHGIGGGDD